MKKTAVAHIHMSVKAWGEGLQASTDMFAKNDFDGSPMILMVMVIGIKCKFFYRAFLPFFQNNLSV